MFIQVKILARSTTCLVLFLLLPSSLSLIIFYIEEEEEKKAPWRCGPPLAEHPSFRSVSQFSPSHWSCLLQLPPQDQTYTLEKRDTPSLAVTTPITCFSFQQCPRLGSFGSSPLSPSPSLSPASLWPVPRPASLIPVPVLLGPPPHDFPSHNAQKDLCKPEKAGWGEGRLEGTRDL